MTENNTKKYAHSAVMRFTFTSALSQENLVDNDPVWAHELLVSAARLHLENLSDRAVTMSLSDPGCAFKLIEEIKLDG